MKSLYRLSINKLSLEEAWNILEAVNIEILYGSEEEGQTELYVFLSSLHPLSSFHWIISCTPHTLPPIDWEAQWTTHGHNFQNGYVHIELDSSKQKVPDLRLKPGPGFGDFSHPTTRLLLGMLAKYLQKEIVVDIGCGSGILMLAAIAMGASFAYGIDIDPKALKHSLENAQLNQLDKQCLFSYPQDFTWTISSQPILILMNMILSEQQMAWSSLPSLHHQIGIYLTSGIRIEERQTYLNLTTQWGWILQEEQEEKGWMTFAFYHNS